METCPALPETGGDFPVLIVVAAINVAVGVALVVLARRRWLPLFVVAVMLGAFVAMTGAAYAQQACPAPTTVSPATAPATTSTTRPATTTTTTPAAATAATAPTTSTTSTSTTTTSTTTTTAPAPVAPTAVNDFFTMSTNTTLALNIFANDFLGVPAAELSNLPSFTNLLPGTAIGFNGEGVATIFAGSTGGVFTGTYTIANAAGSSTATATITVIAPPA